VYYLRLFIHYIDGVHRWQRTLLLKATAVKIHRYLRAFIYTRGRASRFVTKLIDLEEISYCSMKRVLSQDLMRVMESHSSRTPFFWMDTPEASPPAKVSKDIRS